MVLLILLLLFLMAQQDELILIALKLLYVKLALFMPLTLN